MNKNAVNYFLQSCSGILKILKSSENFLCDLKSFWAFLFRKGFTGQMEISLAMELKRFLCMGLALHKKWSINDFFSKCDQIRSFLRIWWHLLKKSLMENFVFCSLWIDSDLLIYHNFILNKSLGNIKCFLATFRICFL